MWNEKWAEKFWGWWVNSGDGELLWHTSQPGRDLLRWGAWRAPASHQLTVRAVAFLGTAVAGETSESSRPESPLQLVRPVASVENKVLGNEWVMRGNVPVDKLFCSCPSDFLERPAVYYLRLSKACCWTRWSGPVGSTYSSYQHHVGKKPLRKRKASG